MLIESEHVRVHARRTSTSNLFSNFLFPFFFFYYRYELIHILHSSFAVDYIEVPVQRLPSFLHSSSPPSHQPDSEEFQSCLIAAGCSKKEKNCSLFIRNFSFGDLFSLSNFLFFFLHFSPFYFSVE